MQIKKTVIKPKIDGVVNDEVWKNLNSANNFTQFKPNNGLLERPTHKTEVKICYDNQNIYFGLIAYDNAADSILKELGKRDDENKNFDLFGIILEIPCWVFNITPNSPTEIVLSGIL